VDWATVLDGIDAALASDQGRAAKAMRVAARIRQAGAYRWVGLYAVTDHEIAAVGWSGPGPPTHLRFPVTQGLSGAAVAGRRSVVVGDVTADPRYLTTFSSTCSEAIIPVVAPATGAVVGALDVESAERDAFTDADQQALERCAAALGACLPRWAHRVADARRMVMADGGSVVPAVLAPPELVDLPSHG
jgi:L-methionine (R)-S-oxide reductase